MAFLGITFGQDQTYTFTEDSFSYRVIIYADVAVGDTAVEVVTTGDDPETPLSILVIRHVGLDSNGTLHLVMNDNDYLLGSDESFEISTAINETVSFGGGLGKPFDVDLDIQAGEGSKLNITLANADIFEVVRE
jgi:hypothetical protein